MPNPKRVHEASTSSPQQHGEVKAVMTLRKGKEVDNKVEMLMTKENQIVPVNVEDSPPEEKEETNPLLLLFAFFFLLFPFLLASHVLCTLFDTNMLPHTQL